MANDFSADSSCKALWKLDNGALVVDSKSTNTLTNTGPVVNDTGDYQEGDASAVMASGHRLTIADANLCAGFPFKNGDTTRLATFCFWYKQTGTSSWKVLLTKGDYATGAFWFGLPWAAMNPTLYVSNSPVFDFGNNVIDGHWTHYALTIDAPNKLVSITTYDAITGIEHIKSGSIAVDIPSASSIFTLGNDSGGSSGTNGKMDEVVVFNRLLSTAEIDSIRLGIYPSTPPTPPVKVNNYAGAPNCISVWRFESGALLTDSKGGDTLVASASPPSVDTINFKEGSSSAYFTGPSSQDYHVADTNLDSGFPFKGGTSNTLGTICFWFRVNDYTIYQQLINKQQTNNFIVLDTYLGYLRPLLYTSAGQEYWNTEHLTGDQWYHVAMRIDGAGKSVGLRVYDSVTQVVTNYAQTTIGTIAVNTGDFYLGSAYHAGSYITGNFDEVVVFNSLLSDSDIDRIRNGTFGTTHNLVASCAAVSAVSAPNAAITRDLQVTAGVQSVVSAPLLAILRNLITSAAALSDTGYPVTYGGYSYGDGYTYGAMLGVTLLVKRDLTTAVSALSATTAPNLLVQRNLAALAVILSETSDITVLTAAIYNLVTTMAAQSQTSSPVLKVLRDLSSIVAGQTQTGTVSLALLMRLVSTLAAETETSSPNLIVLRALATVIAAQTQTSGASLQLLRVLTTAISVASATSNPLLTVLRLLTASLAVVSQTSDIGMGTGAIYDLVSTMVVQSQTPEVSLKVLRDLVSSLAGESATSEISMEFLRRLTTAMAAVSETGTPNVAVLRDLLTAIAIESQTSEIGFMFTGYVPEHLRVRVLLSQLEAELSAPALRAELALRQLKGE